MNIGLMKIRGFKLVTAGILVASMLYSNLIFAETEDDVCTVYLCMAGEVIGQGGGKECKAPIKRFFKLRKFTKGKFKPSATFNLRKQFLGGCTTADPKFVSKILSSFGKKLFQ